MRVLLCIVAIAFALVVPACYSKGFVGTDKIVKVAFQTGGSVCQRLGKPERMFDKKRRRVIGYR